MSKATAPKTVVVLGASFAGIPIAHHLLRYTAALVPGGGLKVILVAPNTHLYWNLGAPRGVLPDQMGDDKLFYPIVPGFARYPASQFEFVRGRATSLDPDARTVVVALEGAGAGGPTTRTIDYHTVVVATGSSPRDGMPWKTLGTTDETKAALHSLRKRIAGASSVVVAGAGHTGVELAGELGQEYASKGLKTVTLVVADDLPLAPETLRSVRVTAQNQLQKLNVRVLAGKKVSAVKPQHGGEAGGPVSLELTSIKDGSTETLKADVYLPTIGLDPNTDFLPAGMLDPVSRRVRTTNTLRAEGYDDVFVVGDAANLEPASLQRALKHVVHVAKDLQARLVRQPRHEGTEYKVDDKVQFGLSLGRNKGTGQMGGMRLPSLMVWYFKSRDMVSSRAPGFSKGDTVKNW